jgi:hypothetical protein
MATKNLFKQSLWIFFLIVILLPGKLRALDLSIKVSFGFSYMSIGDNNDYLESFFTANNLTEPFEHLHLGYYFTGEIYFRLSRRISIFVGTEKILLSKPRNESQLHYTIHSFDHRIEATPLLLGMRYDLNLNRNPSRYYFIPQAIIYVKAAVGYYFTNWTMNYDFNSSNMVTKQTAEANNIGASGAVGMEYRLTRLLSIAVEVSGRYLAVTDYQGERRYSSNFYDIPNLPIKGTLYFFEYSENGTWLSGLQIGEKPDGFDIRNAKPAVVDFSGFSLCVGIKLNL